MICHLRTIPIIKLVYLIQLRNQSKLNLRMPRKMTKLFCQYALHSYTDTTNPKHIKTSHSFSQADPKVYFEEIQEKSV